jgi:hypothetical protein
MDHFAIKKNPDLPHLQVGPDGKLTLQARPDWAHILFMLPNFLCFGCCLSGSHCLTLEFDDVSRRVKYSRNPGYLLCLKRTDEFSYEEIGNVGCSICGFSLGNKYSYTDVLVLRDGRTFVLTHVASHSEIERHCAQLHRFIFGRNNPNYIVPRYYHIL